VARELAPDVRILVRTEHVSEVDELKSLGADCVIPAEFETALALYGRVLDLYEVPPGRVEESVERMRRENYDFLRGRRRS